MWLSSSRERNGASELIERASKRLSGQVGGRAGFCGAVMEAGGRKLKAVADWRNQRPLSNRTGFSKRGGLQSSKARSVAAAVPAAVTAAAAVPLRRGAAVGSAVAVTLWRAAVAARGVAAGGASAVAKLRGPACLAAVGGARAPPIRIATPTTAAATSTAAPIGPVGVTARVSAVAQAAPEISAFFLLAVTISPASIAATTATSTAITSGASATTFSSRFFDTYWATQDLLVLHVFDRILAIARVLKGDESKTRRLPCDPHVGHGSEPRKGILQVLFVNGYPDFFT
eukprot:CAMPEP_0171814164 /NCGR_PEP_ID=MMETSP0991-20121206/79597_1 /TAXON_ID=483369 /ORGANISM="non described non described, Strain CCMP2098" /LENGTH=285 /DNA_ID=CAMNT_0012427783 /DNA_START=116 /DNA_END=970 /DNA_ORIENTATION=-